MLNKLVIGGYYPKESLIHKMSPVIKLINTIIFVIMTFLCNDIRLTLLLFMICFFIIQLSSVPRTVYLRTFANIKYILLFLIIMYYFIGSNVYSTINICLKLYVVVLYTTLLTLTTSPNDLVFGLSSVMLPLKIIGLPVNRIAFSISLAIRFIPTIINQGSKIMKSQASRGIDYFASNLRGKFLAIRSMLIPMFILTLRRADNLADAMVIRQYNINQKRTSLKERKISSFDIFTLIIHIVFLMIILVRMMKH